MVRKYLIKCNDLFNQIDDLKRSLKEFEQIKDPKHLGLLFDNPLCASIPIFMREDVVFFIKKGIEERIKKLEKEFKAL